MSNFKKPLPPMYKKIRPSIWDRGHDLYHRLEKACDDLFKARRDFFGEEHVFLHYAGGLEVDGSDQESTGWAYLSSRVLIASTEDKETIHRILKVVNPDGSWFIRLVDFDADPSSVDGIPYEMSLADSAMYPHQRTAIDRQWSYEINRVIRSLQ